MNRPYILLFISLCFLCHTKLLVAQDNGEDDVGAWWMVFGTHQFAEKWSLHTEIQYRTYEFGQNFNQLLLRTGVNYHFTDNASVTFGYGYIATDPTFIEPEQTEDTFEHRIFEQLAYKKQLGKFTLSHRYRLEQRFLNAPKRPSKTEHRARYLLRVTYPINQKWFITAYDEIFINLQKPLFGQNRLYGALGRNISPSISVQIGYLKNHFDNAHYDRFQLGVWITTNLKKDLNEP